MGIETVVLLVVLGAVLGSFLNVVVMRTGKGSSFVAGRSSCLHCKKPIAWYDLIPVVSFLLLRGRCRSCGHGLALQYLLVELATAFVFGLGGWQIGDWKLLIWFLVATCFFILLFTFDANSYIVPDSISLPGIMVVLLLGLFAGAPVVPLLLGGLFGALWFFIQLIISRGKWVGGGDIRLGALMGVFLGHPFIWLGLGIAYVGGSIIALALVFCGKKRLNGVMPMATLLLPAALLTWLWGTDIWDWYVGAIIRW